MTQISFLELIGQICKRPSMFTGGSVKETLAFINGYRSGNSTPISGRIFDRYVCIRNSFPDNYVWNYVIKTCSKDKKDALRMVEEIITEFVQLKERMSDNELIQYASKQLGEESEAEKIFRQFDKALLIGDESLIKQLIEEHANAGILWEGAYPEDIAIQLNEISDAQSIRSIPISKNGNRLEIISQGWPFPIEMNYANGEWRINAEKIIKLRMSTNRS
ncbi:hypothetical protein [Hymenobacter sp.]|jgi:hypothetical protein|uniref:hypothetical protein n=1 Tax=Hymenobacter sp. TaxID=1898978 RepID=UPI002ED8389A